MNHLYVPGTPNNQFFLMDGNGETTISQVKIWNHPTETTVYKWLFGVPRTVYDIFMGREPRKQQCWK